MCPPLLLSHSLSPLTPRMLSQRQTYFIASLTVALGFGMHEITQQHLDKYEISSPHALSSFHSLLFLSFSPYFSYYSYFRKLATGQQHLTSSAVQLSSEIDKKRNGNGKRGPGGGPTSEDVANMINDLKGKTTREKLEVFLCSFFPSSILSLLLFHYP